MSKVSKLEEVAEQTVQEPVVNNQPTVADEPKGFFKKHGWKIATGVVTAIGLGAGAFLAYKREKPVEPKLIDNDMQPQNDIVSGDGE